MSTATRTDIHRPSADEFDPETYTWLGVFDLHEDPMQGGQRREFAMAVAEQIAQGNTFHGAPHGSGQCSHCGTRLRYAALMLHAETKTIMSVGETCLENRFSVSQGEFRAARHRALAQALANRKYGRLERQCDDNPALAYATYAYNIEVAGGEDPRWCRYEEGWEQGVSVDGERPEWADYSEYRPGSMWRDQVKLGNITLTLNDLVRKAWQYDLSSKQLAYAEALINRLTQLEEWRVERDEKRAAELATRPNAFIGEVKQRREFTGTVRRTHPSQGDYGPSTLIVLDTAEGCVTWWATGVWELEDGQAFAMKATIKGHSEFDGELQTQVTRGKQL